MTVIEAPDCGIIKKSVTAVEFLCPCRKCSLKVYLKEGCPKSCFPYLRMASLDKGDIEDMNFLLMKDIKEIMKSFRHLSNETCKSLARQEVTVDEIIRVAANFDSDTRLRKLKSIDLAFAALAVKISFFNHDILANIIEELGDNNDEKRLTDYTKQLTQFCKRKVFEVEQGDCTCGYKPSQLQGCKSFAVVLPADDKRIIKYFGDDADTKVKFADILNILPSAFHLHRVTVKTC